MHPKVTPTPETLSGEDHSPLPEGVTGDEQSLQLTKIFEAYNDFAPFVKQIVEKLTEDKDSHIGNGSNSYVYLIEKDGQRYAVRLVNGKDAKQITMHTSAAPLAAPLPHVEHIIAASYEDGATVAEVIPGKQMGTLSSEEAQAITPDHISDFANTLKSLQESGINIDPSKPSNFLYDPIEGFGVVDLVAADQNPQNISEVLSWGATILALTDKWFNKKSEGDFARALSHSVTAVNNLEAYRTVIKSIVIPEGQRVTALKNIDDLIDNLKATVMEYSDAAWVTRAVEEANRPPRKVSDEEMNAEM